MKFWVSYEKLRKKAPITETTTQEVKKDDASRTSQTPVATEEKKEETK